jgi:hypothetical protein
MSNSSIEDQLPSSHPRSATHRDLTQWQLALRVFAAPTDTNLNGDICAGWPLAQADIAAASIAVARARGRAGARARRLPAQREPGAPD